MRKRGLIDAFWLKIIMAVLMVLDHLYYGVFRHELLWAHYAARVVAPTFCYLMTEGMTYTRDRRKYIARMYAFAAAMLAGNAVLYALYGRWIDNSILLSLAIAASVIAYIDRARESSGVQKTIMIVLVVQLFVICLIRVNGQPLVEGEYMIPLMAVIFYYLRHHPLAMWLSYAVVFCLPYLLLINVNGGLHPQFYMLFAFVPILCYNGKRGRGGAFGKYFFYVFYPLHIWIIFFIERALP